MNYKHTQYWHFGQSTMCPWDQWLLSWTVKRNDRQNTLVFFTFCFFSSRLPLLSPLAVNTEVFLCNALGFILFSFKTVCMGKRRGSKGFWECNPILWACIQFFVCSRIVQKMLGGFSLKAWLLSCFCLITGHKVRSTSLTSVQLLVIPFLLQKYSQIASCLCPVKWLIFYLVNHILGS